MVIGRLRVSERPMTVGELIDYLTYNHARDRIVLIQDYATRHSGVVPCIIKDAYMKKASDYQYEEDENGAFCAVLIGY